MKPIFSKFNLRKSVRNLLRGRNSGESSNSSLGSSSERLIAAEYKTLEQVSESLSLASLGPLSLICGIDFTQSNEWTGEKSFDKRSLHHIGDGLNPYEQVICILRMTLSPFDEDNLIPCYGFGDASTRDRDVFCFYPDTRFCNGVEEEVLSRYREIVLHVRLSVSTSFAPIIEMADHRHTARWQVGGLQEQKTTEAIVEASKYPLSIILVGVGDGPWDSMSEFCENIPARDFDNFQFVNFTEIMSKNEDTARKETEFALTALMKVPSQYRAAVELNLLGQQRVGSCERVPHPPPMIGETSFSSSELSSCPSFRPTGIGTDEQDQLVGLASLYLDEECDEMFCTICTWNLKSVIFDCGHQTCNECSERLKKLSKPCPFCRSVILTRTTFSCIV